MNTPEKNKRRQERLVWDLDWNLLRSFMVIAETQSITRAAERLGLRQPSVSNLLKRLEDRLQIRLVERDATRFELTEAGRRVFDQATSVFASVSRLPELLEAGASEVTGHVTIAVASHVVTPLFDESLAEFRLSCPRATIGIDVHSSAEVARLVAEQRAAFGLCLVNLRDSSLEYTHLYRQFFGFFCGPGHRLFGQSGLTLADLDGEAAVTFQTDKLADALRPVALLRSEARVNSGIVGVSSSLEEVRRMIVAGMGIGPLPLHIARRDEEDSLLWRLPPYDDPPAVDCYLVSNPKHVETRAEAALLTILRRRIDAMPLDRRTYRG